MLELWESLVQLFDALLRLVLSLGGLLLPWIPLLAWVAFWLLAVNWRKLSHTLRVGGWTGLFLISVTAVLVWGLIAPPEDGVHHILGLTLSNYVGKTVYVTTLICIMLLCGTVQLSGVVNCCTDFERFETPADDHAHHGHGHDGHGDHGGHGHDAHGNGDHGLISPAHGHH